MDKTNRCTTQKGKGKICARACAVEGCPFGVLTGDGKVYHVTGEFSAHSNAKLIPHMGQTVAIKGEVKDEGGQLFLAATELTEAAH